MEQEDIGNTKAPKQNRLAQDTPDRAGLASACEIMPADLRPT